MTQSESIKALSEALTAAYGEMPKVPFDSKNPFYDSEFASLGAVISTARPILAKHGLAVMQFACSDEQGRVGVRTRLLHSSAEWMEDVIYLEILEEKGKPRAQVACTIITYLRRYAQSALLNLYADADTDGNAPGAPVTASKEQAAPAQPKPNTIPAKAPSAQGTQSLAENCKARFLAIIKEKKWEIFAWKLFVDSGWLLPTERLDEANMKYFPLTAESNDALLKIIKLKVDEIKASGGVSQELEEAYTSAHLPEPAKPEFSLDKRKDEPWRSIPIPTWSKHFKEDGFKTFGELSKEQLWWWCAKWQPTGYKGKPPKQEDVVLRAELDKVREAYGFTE